MRDPEGRLSVRERCFHEIEHAVIPFGAGSLQVEKEQGFPVGEPFSALRKGGGGRLKAAALQEPVGRDTRDGGKQKERCFLSGKQQRQVCETVIGCNRIEQQETEQGAKPRGSGRGTKAVGCVFRGLTGSRVREQREQAKAFLVRKEAGADC